MLDQAPLRTVALPPRPHSVTTAARLMIVAATVSGVYLIVTLVDLDGVRHRLRDATPRPSEASVTASLTVSLGYYLAVLVLFPLFTRHVTQARNWARLATWALGGIGVAITLSTLGRDESGVSRVLSLVALVLDVAIVALLVAPTSSRYFRPVARTSPPMS
ncbi:MAG: hypothetical protein ABI345_14430 [Jatrophihabitans sp.]